MDRETILRILRKHSFGVQTMDMGNIIEVVTSFIIDKGKTEKEARDFVSSVLSHPIECGTLLIECYNIAMQYYEREFSICKLYSTPNPLNQRGKERTLLLIF